MQCALQLPYEQHQAHPWRRPSRQRSPAVPAAAWLASTHPERSAPVLLSALAPQKQQRAVQQPPFQASFACCPLPSAYGCCALSMLLVCTAALYDGRDGCQRSVHVIAALTKAAARSRRSAAHRRPLRVSGLCTRVRTAGDADGVLRRFVGEANGVWGSALAC